MFTFYRRWQINSLRRKAERLVQGRHANNVSDSELRKEIQLYYKIAALYDRVRFNKRFPYAQERALEAYRAASALGDINGQFIVGKRLIEKGVFWDQLKKTIFACKAHDKYARDCYEEAFVYLQSAMQSGHLSAKRLLGLAQIRGWGTPIDKQKGLQLIIDSIEQEGSWDKTEKIAAELGMDKAEFFSSIAARKNTGSQAK